MATWISGECAVMGIMLQISGWTLRPAPGESSIEAGWSGSRTAATPNDPRVEF